MADTPRFVYNLEVAGLHRRINRFIVEMGLCASNQGSQMSSFDQERLITYLTAIKTYIAWVTSQPQLDLPETSPNPIVLDKDPEVAVVENEAITDILRMMVQAREELVNGQSSRQPSGFIKFDVSRVLAIVDKIEKFLTDYVQKITPLDLPESSPSRAIAPKGSVGV